MNESELLKVQHEIVQVNVWLDKFWSNSYGWAPSADLISKSRLDNQVALSHTLKIWIEQKEEQGKNGRLILAWANLGALIEGTLKLYLCVFHNDYSDDIFAYRNKKNNKLQDADSLVLEKIRVFFKKRDLWTDEWDEYVLNVQRKRNAIHAFQDKDIGDFEEFYSCLPPYLEMLRCFNLGLPYPDFTPKIISEELAPIMDKMRVRFEKKYNDDDFYKS
jgi:hypothetical protein